VPSQPISTRAASRHRMAANGFRCSFVASAIVSAYDRPGASKLGREAISARPGARPSRTICVCTHKSPSRVRFRANRTSSRHRLGADPARAPRHQRDLVLQAVHPRVVPDLGVARRRHARDGDRQ
jgi:hypothetical protein